MLIWLVHLGGSQFQSQVRMTISKHEILGTQTDWNRAERKNRDVSGFALGFVLKLKRHSCGARPIKIGVAGFYHFPHRKGYFNNEKKWCALNSRRAGWTVLCCLVVMAFSVFLQWGIFTPHGEVLLLHIMDQSAGGSLCGTLLLVMWQFPARDFHSYLAFGFLHDAVINASMLRVIIVLAEEDVFVLSHSPLVWCFSLLFPYLWLVGMHLYLASVLLTFKESSKVRLLHLYRECQLQVASSTMKTWSRTFLSLKMRNMLLNI